MREHAPRTRARLGSRPSRSREHRSARVRAIPIRTGFASSAGATSSPDMANLDAHESLKNARKPQKFELKLALLKSRGARCATCAVRVAQLARCPRERGSLLRSRCSARPLQKSHSASTWSRLTPNVGGGYRSRCRCHTATHEISPIQPLEFCRVCAAIVFVNWR